VRVFVDAVRHANTCRLIGHSARLESQGNFTTDWNHGDLPVHRAAGGARWPGGARRRLTPRQGRSSGVSAAAAGAGWRALTALGTRRPAECEAANVWATSGQTSPCWRHVTRDGGPAPVPRTPPRSHHAGRSSPRILSSGGIVFGNVQWWRRRGRKYTDSSPLAVWAVVGRCGRWSGRRRLRAQATPWPHGTPTGGLRAAGHRIHRPIAGEAMAETSRSISALYKTKGDIEPGSPLQGDEACPRSESSHKGWCAALRRSAARGLARPP